VCGREESAVSKAQSQIVQDEEGAQRTRASEVPGQEVKIMIVREEQQESCTTRMRAEQSSNDR
jgi:hypothetical protein